MQVRVISNITKVYPDMIKVVIYKEPRYFVQSDRRVKRVDVSDCHYNPTISSLSRTKSLVQDIVLCNDFELFCTFTFSPKFVDRYDFNKCSMKMRLWLHHQRDVATSKGNDFKYLVIPEQHKDGAWHFHALLKGYSSTLKDSGLRTSSLRPIYNITSFRSGFTTATPIDSKEGVSSYVTKYITKDFIKKFNRRRFFCSRNLIRPTRELNSKIFRNTLPIFRKKIGESLSQEFFEILA